MADVEMQQEAAASGPRADKPAGSNVDSNYQYWRDHGGEWADHYDTRKKRMVLYHIQELMLTTYINEHATRAANKPLRVLELGCGVGRHLRNLSRLPDVDVHGYDQSRAMAEGMLRWASREWFNEHVRVGMPTGRLPFDDGSFDIVYSAEVLVHVRPEHLEGILREMVRVCRGHVLHLETSPDFPLVSGEHSGCWRHSLPDSYAKMGMHCEVLPAGYAAHTPFRVTVKEAPAWTWPAQIIEMYRRMERDIDSGFAGVEATAAGSQAAAAERQQAIVQLQQQLAANEAAMAQQVLALEQSRSRIVVLQQELEAVSTRASALQGRIGELDAALTQAAELRTALNDENEALRNQYAEMRKARDWAMAQIAALNAHIEKMGAGWDADRQGFFRLMDERRAFADKVSRLLGIE